MLSIKKISQKNIWLFAWPLLVLVVIILVFKFLATDQPIKNKEQYLQAVRPQLERVIAQPTESNIAETTEFLLNLKSSERSIGDYHLPLYMAFSLWTKYTESGELTDLSKALAILAELKLKIPELAEPLESLMKIMQNNA